MILQHSDCTGYFLRYPESHHCQQAGNVPNREILNNHVIQYLLMRVSSKLQPHKSSKYQDMGKFYVTQSYRKFQKGWRRKYSHHLSLFPLSHLFSGNVWLGLFLHLWDFFLILFCFASPLLPEDELIFSKILIGEFLGFPAWGFSHLRMCGPCGISFLCSPGVLRCLHWPLQITL